MIFTLTDRHYNVLDAYETDDYLIGQYIGSILETLEINVLVKSLNAEHWVEGNYIMCQDKRGKKRWFTIYDCEDSNTGDSKSLFCYSGTIDIVAEDAAPISAPDPKPFKWYFDQIFYDTGIELGINEISDLTRKLEFTSENASNAEMLQYVLNGFGNAEASLDVEFDGATPTKLVLNVYKRIGNEEPQAILSDEDDSLTSLNRKGSISDLATCINPTGAEDENGNPITLVGKYYEEKDENGNILYYSPVDSPRVFSVVAHQNFYVQLPGKANGEFDGYINRRYSSQATTQDTLWQESLAQLKKIDHVAVTYEANGYIDCSIGDNVQIVSHEMKPPVMIAARTIEYKFNDDDPSRNVYKFGNYVELTSNLDELSKIVSDLKQKLLIVTVVASAGTVFKNGTGETDLTAVTILGGKEVDTDGLFYNYVWSKYDKNGNFVGATSGKSITVYARNIDEKETYIVTVENEGAKSIGQITVTNVNDGAQGPPGKSSYTHVAYANSADGRTDFSLTDSNREYIGMYVDDNPTNSTDPTKYKWTLVKGADGAQGIQGPPGADGRTPYLHIAYANSADGRTGFSTTDSANKLYIGQYTDFNPADSTDPAKYSWTRIKGDKGEPGYTPVKGVDYFDGKDGQDGKSSYLWIKYSVNSNGNPMTDNPAGALYIGVATTTTPTAPTSYTAYKWSLIKGADGIPGERGQDGRTSYLHIRYSNDGGKTFTANNGETVGAWMGTYVDFTQADSTNPADYTWNKVKGEQGPQGVQGPPGADGQSLYTWVKYADDASGNGMSDYPDGKKYVGLAYNKTTPTESTNPADYTWALIQGPQGVKGTDGQTYYTWIKYADSPTSGMSDDPTGKKYMGIAYNKPTPTESTNYSDYSWSLVQGPQGPKGEQGPAGKGVSSIVEQYYLSTSNTTQTGGSWSTTPPAWQDGKYMWTRSVITYTDGTSATTNPVCVTGAKGPTGPTGNGIQSVDVEYYLSTSATALSGGTWTTTAPTWQDGKYMWSRTKTVYTNGTTTYSDPACITGAKGPQGPQGVPGPKGEDGQTLYTWIKYADSPTSGMSDTPDGKKYIGLAYNKTTPTESSNYADYSWSLIQGPQGVQGPKGADGVTTYTWVKYADDDRGNGMSDSPNGKRYLGLAYNKTTPTESTNPNDYSWSPLYDNVQVGGRNLIKNTSDQWKEISMPAGSYFSEFHEDVELIVGETYTFSVVVEKVSDDSVPINLHIGNGTGGNYTWDFPTWRLNNIPFGQKISLTHTIKSTDVTSTRKYFSWRLRNERLATKIRFKEVKLEKGNVATDWTPAPEDTQAEIDQAKRDAQAEIDQAKRDAQNAQSTADGKNTVFYQATAPSTVGRKVNDLWYDTDDGYKPYYFNGSSWIPAPFGNAAIANLDAGKITTGYLNALRIAASSIEAKHIKSLNGLNVGNGQFVVDANGNVKFAGNLEGATGTFGEVTVKDGDFYLKDTKSGIRYSLIKKTNILGDHSFELIKVSEPTSQDNIDHWWLPIITDNTNWETIGSPRGVPISISGPGPADAMPIFGNRALLVNSTNYIEQPVWDITANTQYTFSVHAKRPYNNTPGAVRLEVHYYKLNIDGTSSRTLVAAQSFDTVASDYSVSRHALTFTSPNIARTGSDQIIFVIKGVNANWVHVDGVQVVKSAYPTVYDTEDSLWSFMNSRNGFKARAIWTEGIYNGVNGIDIDANRIRIYSNESLNYFSVENIESRFSTVPYDQWKDPEPNVKKSIKVNGGIATDGLYANAGSISKTAISTNGKIYVGGEGIEIAWPGGTPYIDFVRLGGYDYTARIINQGDSLVLLFNNSSVVRHKFNADGTKSGGSIEIDGKNLGMSPIDSPQVLLETIEFDVPLTADGTKVLLDSRFAKAVNYRFAVFPNNGRVIEKGADYFIIAGEGLADIRIIGERVGYAGVYFDDMTMEGVT